MRTIPAVESVPCLPQFELAAGDASKKLKKMLKDSREHLFREKLYQTIPVDELAALFCPNNGAPAKNPATLIGLLFFQQLNNWTNEEALEELAFNQKLRYALHIDVADDKTCYVSRRTWYYFLKMIVDNHLDDVIFDTFVKWQLANYMPANPAARMDSSAFKTNFKDRKRIGLIRDVIRNFLRDVKKQDGKLLDEIGPELTGKYLKGKDSWGMFGEGRPADSAKDLQGTVEDLFALVRRFTGEPVLGHALPFRLMERVLREQCNVIPAGSGGVPGRVEPKNPKDVRSDSLQSFSDPDVTYSGHKGKGLKAQTAELFDRPPLLGDGDAGRVARKPACIFHVEVEGIDKHDQHALPGAMERGRQLGADADVWLADTCYGSYENFQLAKGKGSKLVAPVPGKAPEAAPGAVEAPAAPPALRPESCPRGEDGGPAGELDARVCPDCPCLKRCRAAFSSKKAVNDERRADMATGESKALYRMRAGKEATYSIGKGKHGMGRLRVRGKQRASLKIKLTALCINFGRVFRYEMGLKK